MSAATPVPQEPTFNDRLAALRRAKEAATREKQQIRGAMDHDDHGVILPPPDRREVIETTSSSGMPIRDVLLTGVPLEEETPGEGFFGPRLCGLNFRRLLEAHPVHIDPNSSLAGAYMTTFSSYRTKSWPDRLPVPEDLRARLRRYRLVHAIGAMQHFCQDLRIGLELGWDGILERLGQHRARHPDAEDFYAGLEHIVFGMQDWIGRAAREAERSVFQHPELGDNLQAMAAINQQLVHAPPRTFREACQWILWYQLVARMYNGSGSLGRLDLLLEPYYARDRAAGDLSDEEAVFHIACLLLRDNAYLQLGGPTATRDDVTSPVSHLVLEAAHRLGIPANIGVCVGQRVDRSLLRRGVEIMLSDRTGIPKFLGVDNTAAGFLQNGFPARDARERAYSGCHWSAIPGREYALMDCIKVDFGAIFEAAFADVMAGEARSSKALWQRFVHHLQAAVTATAEAIDFQFDHMHEVFPELVLSLLCHGPVERGVDASHGGVDYYTFGVDGAALATIADSFAAIEVRLEGDGRLDWEKLATLLADDFAGPEGERLRLLLANTPRFGRGGGAADRWAERIAHAFTAAVVAHPTPGGHRMLPGLFSWANTIPMGATLGATPNGRRRGEPISHGANPQPGFCEGGAPTAMVRAVAAVQTGYGNTVPLQLDLEPSLSGKNEADVERVCQLIETHFRLGGTQINLNLLSREEILEAHADPEKYPHLVVRVTGFSAYFASLSPAFRQLVVDRIVAG